MVTAPLQDSSTDEDVRNPGKKAFDGIINSNYTADELRKLEGIANGSNSDNEGSISDQEKDGSAPDADWDYNDEEDEPRNKGQAKKVLLSFVKTAKGKGAMVAVAGLLGLGGASATLVNTFAGPGIASQIIERFTGNSGFIGAADNNIWRAKIFGGSNLSTTCTFGKISCKFQGLSSKEMDALRANGAILSPEGGRVVPDSDGKLFTFDSLTINGETLDAKNFNRKMSNPFLHSRLKAIKPTALWKTMNNVGKTNALRSMGVNRNPDTRATTPDELKNKVYKNVHTDPSNDIASNTGNNQDPGDEGEAAAKEDYDTKATGVEAGSADLSSKIKDLEEAAANGDWSDIKPIPLGDLAETLARDGAYGSLEDAKSSAGKAWGWINSVDIADTICTVYQVANTALMIAKTVTLINTVRYGYMFISMWQKQMAGEATAEETNELMTVLMTPDKYSSSFDSTTSMQYLFSGQLATAGGSAMNAHGGSVMQTLSSALIGINSLAGAGILGASGGKVFLTQVCGIATNLAFQIGATVVDLTVTVVASIFSGGAYAGVRGVGGAAAKAALKTAVSTLRTGARTIVKEAITNSTKKLVRKGMTKAEKQIANKKARKAVADLILDPWNIAGVAMILVENFGMEYIVNSMSGTDVIGMMESSTQSADAIITAAATDDYISGVTTGGYIQTLDTIEAYDEEVDKQIALYRNTEELEANPLDISNPYSKLGSFMSSFALKMGSFINSSSLYTSTMSLLNTPIKSLGALNSSFRVSAGTKATAKEIADYIDDPYSQKHNIAVDIVGNPRVGADIAYIQNTPVEELLDSAIEAGYITSSGAIVPGSAYEDHVNNCNNPNKTQINDELFDESIVQPASCRDSSNSNLKMFNAITTYRSLLGEEVASQDTGALVLPTDTGYQPRSSSTDYGPRSCTGACTKWHRGIDLSGHPGGALFKPVYSATDGEVIASGKGGQGGNGVKCAGAGIGPNNTVEIRAPNGAVFSYLHMGGADITVSVGDKVSAGDTIGKINNCGNSYGAHLHFMIETDKVDALQYPEIAALTKDPTYHKSVDPVLYYALFGLEI